MKFVEIWHSICLVGGMENISPIQNPSFKIKTPFMQMTDDALARSLKDAVHQEKVKTLEVLEYLLEVERRKLYSIRAYSSLFEYAVHELGYSESQASERINSMRLLRAVPEIKQKLENGDLSITTASQIQRFIKNEKRFAGDDLSLAEKERLIDLCSNQSKREVERTLFAMQSEEAKVESSERTRWVSEQHVELKFLVSESTLKKISEVRNMVGEATLGRVFSEALDSHLEVLKKKHQRVVKRVDEVTAEKIKEVSQTFILSGESSVAENDGDAVNEKPTERPSESVARPATWTGTEQRTRYVPVVLRRMVFARSKGQCEFYDAKTKNRCLARFRLQIDHILPFALGGKTQVDNLRHLCPNHNQRSAIEFFS